MPRKKPAVTALMARIGGADKQDAGEAIAELVALGPDAAAAATALRPLVKDKEPRRGLGARAVLAAIGEDTAAHVDVLIERAGLGKADEGAVARTLLRDLPIGAVADGLARAFTHAKPEVRTRAIGLAAGTVQLREALPVDDVIALLKDADPKVREAAMQALHQHLAPTPPAKPTAQLTGDRRKAIQPLLADPDRAVVAQAKRLWDKLGIK
jgi:hypothetical protein